MRPVTDFARFLLFWTAAVTLIAGPTGATEVISRDDVRYPRGDTDCDANFTAADVAAMALALGDREGCGNDDCDRDGEITAEDIDCTARCLFGQCPPSPIAPVVLEVEPDSAPGLAPGSQIRITGASLYSDEQLGTVTIGGRIAPITEAISNTEITVIVPPLEPGPTDLVVHRGDVASTPFAIVIAAPATIGEADTFASTMSLLDEVLGRVAGLDLTEPFGTEAAAVATALDDLRQRLTGLAGQLESELSPEEGAWLDAQFESSGAAEQLRDLIADLDSLGDDDASLSGTVAIAPVLRSGARTVRIVAGVAETTGAILSAPAGAVIAAGATVIGGLLVAANDPVQPLIFDIEFHDRFGIEQPYVSAGGSITIRGARFDSVTTGLELRVGRGLFVRDGGDAGDALVFEVPHEFGICGPIALNLTRALTASNRVTTRVQPELDSLSPDMGMPGDLTTLETRGFAGCDGNVLYERGASGNRGPFSHAVGYRVTEPDAGTLTLPVPYFIYGGYRVVLDVAGLRTVPPDRIQTIDDGITGVDIVCEDLQAPPAVRQLGLCEASLIPGIRSFAPLGAQIEVGISDTGVVEIAVPPSGLFWGLKALRAGQATISVEYASGFNPEFVVARGEIPIAVEDVTPPSVRLSPSTTQVDPGDSFQVTVHAEDNTGVDEISLDVTGDAVGSVTPQGPPACPGLAMCERTFTVAVKETGFSDPFIRLSATATDTGDLSTTSEPISVAVDVDFACPQVVITQPNSGSTVDPGETIRVRATASDAESGVVRFSYTASGPALVDQISREQILPAPQSNAPLVFDLVIRSAQQLSSVVNRDVDITVEAEDAAGNVCNAATLEITVSGGPNACGYSPEVARFTLSLHGSFDGDAGPESVDFNIPIAGTFPGSVVAGAVLYEATDQFFRDAQQVVLVERMVRLDAQLNDDCTKIESFNYRHREDVTNTMNGFSSFRDVTISGGNVSATSTGTTSADFREEGVRTCNSIDSISFEQGVDDDVTRTLLDHSCNSRSLFRISLERQRDR